MLVDRSWQVSALVLGGKQRSSYRLDGDDYAATIDVADSRTSRFVKSILLSVLGRPFFMNGIDTKLTPMVECSQWSGRESGLTVRPASSNPSICCNAILASSALLYLGRLLGGGSSKELMCLLNKSITFTAARHGIPMQINELEFTENFKDLFDI